MKLTIPALLCLMLLGCGSAGRQEGMTPELFNSIANAPGDTTPLAEKLVGVPYWSEAVCSNYMRYQDGRVFTEQCSVAAKTVQGKYIVFTMDSQYYKQPMHGILSYDEKAQAYKQWALFGTNLTEATVVIDFEKKISAWTGTYEPGFMEISVGTFSDKESSEHAVAYKNGTLFMTRDSKTWAVTQRNAKPGGAASLGQPIRSETNRTFSSVAVTNQVAHWPIPADLPSFGTSTSNLIQVAVFGADGIVNRPGFYYLPKGAIVRDAINAAQGLSEFALWSNSGIERRREGGSFQLILFTRGNRKTYEQMLLQDGDRIYFGREYW